MFLTVLLFMLTPTVFASECDQCHGEVAKVDNFYDPAVPKVTNQNIKCYKCHAEGLHTRDYNPGTTLVSKYFTDLDGSLNVAFFLSNPDMASVEQIHKAHSQPDPRASMCASCHLSISCNACHEVVPHGNSPLYHGSTKYPMANVNMTSADPKIGIIKQISCSTSQCHGTFTESYVPVVKRSDGTQLCLNCHTTDRNGHQNLAVKHQLPGALTSQTTNLDCTLCHKSDFDLEHKGKVGDAGNILDCATCHNATYKPTITGIANGTITKNCDACHDNTGRHNTYPVSHENNFPTDANMDCSACHSNDLRAEHMVAGSNDPNTSCKRCHEYTGTRASVDKSVVMNAITNNQTKCSACHSIHASVQTIHDFSTKFVPNNTAPGCTSCHSGSLDVEHSFNKLTNTARVIKDGDFAGQTIAGTSDSCKICHNSLTTTRSTEVKTVVKATGDKYCTSCHVLHNDDLIHTLDVDAATSTYKYTTTTETAKCADCHKPVLHQEHAGWGVGCNKCHGDTNLQPGFDPAVIANAVATGAKNCDACHNSTRLPKPVHSTVNHNGVFPVQFINCKTCHTNVLDVEHAKWSDPVSMQKYDCKVCHNSTKVEVRNAIALGNRECAACHINPIHPSEQYTPKHNGNFPRPANLASYDACTTCHYDNLLTDHSRTPDVGKEVYCTDCHNSTNTQVQNAIKSLNTNCAACHAEATIHSADVTRHATTFMATPPFSCNNCHQEAATKGLIEEHLTRKDASGNSFTCATCHKSANTKVTTAIANRATNCDACHTIHGDVTTVHTINNTVAGKEWPAEPVINCSMCHNTQVHTEHTSRPDKNVPDGSVNYTCDTCHASTRQDVKNAITQNKLTCTVCHGPAHASVETQHQGDFIVKDGYNCADCHTAVTGVTTKGKLIPIHEKLGCQVCHSTTARADVQLAITNKNPNCSACHGDATTVHANDAQIHSGDPLDTTKVDCSKCHNQSLFVEHLQTANRTDDAGNPVNCNTCHQSTKTQVTGAIAAKNSNCSACHAIHPDDEATKHTNGNFAQLTNVPNVNCASCHNANVTQEHGVTRTKTTAGVTMNCNTCHTSTRTDVTTAISTDNAKCNACHSVIHSTTSVATQHKSAYGTNATGCVDCHNSQLETVHTGTTKLGVAMNCNTCHNSSVQKVKDAIAANNTNCDACHTVHGDITEKHTIADPNQMVNNQQFSCKDCHKTYLPEEHLKAIGVSTGTTESSSIAYEIFRSTSATSGFTKVGNVVGTSYSDGKLAPNTTYYYQVKAYDVAGLRSNVSNTASAKTPATPPASKKVNPSSAYYCEGNGDSYSDNNKYNALSALTNGRDSTSSSDSYQIREDGSSDKYVWVRLNNTDAKDYKAIKLELRFRWYSSDSSGNILVYPYQSNGSSINTSGVVNYKMTNLNTNWVTHTIDVTTAAKTMNNFGWMKFRVKPGSDGREERAYLSEVRIILENDATAETGVTTPDSFIAQDSNNGDTTPPTAPSNLAGVAVNSVQVNLNWTASTDVGPPPPAPDTSGTCKVCHSSTYQYQDPTMSRDKVNAAVANNQTKCDSCHTIHNDIETAHTTTLPTTPWNCSGCHKSTLTEEHKQWGKDCATCHNSTDTKVQSAITNKNADCAACHTVHTTITGPHLSKFVPENPERCSNCHDSVAKQILSTTVKSMHAVGTTPKAANVTGGYLPGWSPTTIMKCTDCHGANNADGTTTVGKILKRPFSASTSYSTSNDLCFMCHSYNVYGNNGTQSPSVTRFNDGKENLHTDGDHQKNGISCVSCHTWLPHAGNSTYPAFLGIVGDGAPYASRANNIRITYPSTNGGWNKDSCATNCGEHSTR